MPTAKKRASHYRPECKKCNHVGDPHPVATVKKNLEGKMPISCTSCGSKTGYKWLPVTEKA